MKQNRFYRKIKNLLFACGLILFAVHSASLCASESNINFDKPRRQSQFPTAPAHLYVPLPYSMPGIGSGLFLMAYLSNLAETTTDAALVAVEGDASGFIGELDEIPLLKDRLLLKLFSMNISQAAINDYQTRGMNNNSSEFNVLDISDVKQLEAELSLNFWDRRLEFHGRYRDQKSSVNGIRDSDGVLLTTLDPPQITRGIQRSAGMMLDLTDDFFDPRAGFRFRLDYQDKPSSDLTKPDFYVLDYSLIYYLPLRKDDTLVFNYYRSDAHVRRTGLLDPQAIASSIGVSCAPDDTLCIEAGNQRVANILAHNQNGTATTLGGTDRLRSYADGRFSGGHMGFVGAEYRLNFLQDARPFDFFIWKDIPTSIQLAMFAELGSVGETSSALWDDSRASYGLGLRLLSKSGSVYRLGLAAGDEGTELTIFFFYPWK